MFFLFFFLSRFLSHICLQETSLNNIHIELREAVTRSDFDKAELLKIKRNQLKDEINCLTSKRSPVSTYSDSQVSKLRKLNNLKSSNSVSIRSVMEYDNGDIPLAFLEKYGQQSELHTVERIRLHMFEAVANGISCIQSFASEYISLVFADLLGEFQDALALEV